MRRRNSRRRGNAERHGDSGQGELTDELPAGAQLEPVVQETHADVAFTLELPTGPAVFKGQLAGDTIKGKWDSDWSGETVTRDWEAKRAKE